MFPVESLRIWEVHPMLVHFPIALLLAAVVVDLWTFWRPAPSKSRVAAGLLFSGSILGWPAAALGLVSFFTVPETHTEQAHVWMYWHLGVNAAALGMFTWLAVLRAQTRDLSASWRQATGEVVASLFLVAGAYVGGLMVYHGGAGMSPEVVQQGAPAHEHEHGHGSEGEEEEEEVEP